MAKTLQWTASDGTFHEIYSAAAFVGKSFLGELEYDSGRSDLRWHRSSTAYFCPECGDIWGRIVAQDSRGKPKAFEVARVACAQHYDHWNVPGSFLVGHLEYLLGDLPLAALRRELEVHLTYAERKPYG